MKWNNPGQEFALGKIYKEKNKIYLYGAGDCGRYYMNFLKEIGALEAFDGFIDHDKQKQKNGVESYKVIDPASIFDCKPKDHIIIVSIDSEDIRNRIIRRLQQAGYIYGSDFFDPIKGREIFNNTMPCFMTYALGKVNLSSNCCMPTTVCNLNCRDCLNFTPYIKHFEIRNIDEVCQDEDLFFEWVYHTDLFQISGGEPLLYKNLPELIEYLGRNYRDRMGIFETVFNGTVIPDDKVCKVMSDYNMRVVLDDYRANIPRQLDKREKIISMLDKFNIKWVDNYVPDWFSLDIEHTDNSAMTDEELTEYYDMCGNPWHYYHGGKLYSCNFAAFAMKAGIIRESANDYFDFNQPRSRENMIRLFEFANNYTTKGYVDFCKKCAGWASFNHSARVPVAVQAVKKNG